MRPPLYAATLWPEWAWAFAHLDKRVENRSWKHGLPVGTWLAIHAGAYIGGRKGKVAEVEGVEALLDMAARAGWQRFGNRLQRGERRALLHRTTIAARAVVGVGRIASSTHGLNMGWAVPGAEHWPLNPFIPFTEPVPCERGKQGLWRVGGELLEACRVAMGAARKAQLEAPDAR